MIDRMIAIGMNGAGNQDGASGEPIEDESHPWNLAVGSRLYQRPVEALRAVFGHLTPEDLRLHQLVDDAIHGAPNVRIAAIRALGDELPERLDTAVRDGRAGGMTWTGIGRVLGISRQAVQQRYDRPLEALGDPDGSAA